MGLRILALFFIVTSILSIIHIGSIIEPILSSKNLAYIAYTILYTIFYAVGGFITAIGLFKRKRWARKFAIILIIFKTAQIIIDLIKDLIIMIESSVGIVIISSAVALILVIIAIMISLIAYLNRDSVKNQFY